MRLVFVADGRSPIARSWIEYFVRVERDVRLVSTRPCAGIPGLASLEIVSLWPGGGAGAARRQRNLAVVTALRHWLGPWMVRRRAATLRGILRQWSPDLVHALRLPYEGMLAAAADPAAPLAISTWGNDLTLHAPASPMMRWSTRHSLRRAAGLHADCRRDEHLAATWGFRAVRPTLVVPGNGGVRRQAFFPGRGANDPDFGIDPRALVVVQPRGLRAYVRSDTFFRAIPLIRQHRPEVVFACPAMEGAAEAERWRSKLDLGSSLRLLPALDAASMGALFRRASVSVSPSTHDGTPNTLLEAMACGCLPVAGDLDSIREWVSDGENGLLVDPADESALAAAVLRGLSQEGFRARAAAINVRRIAERAEYDACMAQASSFYERVLRGGPEVDAL
ncbi:MAG TPA: glycosyltransferase family 4 protein [Anaerolineales bacterium]|nr:glycosyltransferase family 4 protein [Anaerolineales bacterium]